MPEIPADSRCVNVGRYDVNLDSGRNAGILWSEGQSVGPDNTKETHGDHYKHLIQ